MKWFWRQDWVVDRVDPAISEDDSSVSPDAELPSIDSREHCLAFCGVFRGCLNLGDSARQINWLRAWSGRLLDPDKLSPRFPRVGGLLVFRQSERSIDRAIHDCSQPLSCSHTHSLPYHGNDEVMSRLWQPRSVAGRTPKLVHSFIPHPNFVR